MRPNAAEPTVSARFEGFAPATFSWFAGLQQDNSKRYFTEHRETYDIAVRGALETMLEQFADELGGHVRMFRQNRDLRFSADKSPYKTTTYGLIADRSGGAPALYAQLSSLGLFAGSGYYVLAPDQLARFRDAVAGDDTGPALERVIAAVRHAGVETFGEALKVAPRGYPRDHPRVELLRHKALFAGSRLQAGPDGIARDAALRHAGGTWQACAPLNEWLDANVGRSEIPAETRYRRTRSGS